MITPMKKQAFMVFHSDYHDFVKRLGQLGVLHVIEKKSPEEKESLADLKARIDRIEHASAIIAGRGDQVSPSTAWTGKAYIVCSTQFTAPHKPGGACIRPVDGDGKPLGPKKISGGSAGFRTSIGFAGKHAIVTVTTRVGKVYTPNFCYAIFLNADGSIAKPANCGHIGFKDPRVLRGVPAIRLSFHRGTPYVFAPAAAGRTPQEQR